jgi:hypothetical protein
MRFYALAKAAGSLTGGSHAVDDSATPAEDLLAEELARCSDCGRTPLIGEQVHLYESADLVCELCRMLRGELPVLSAQVTPRFGPLGRNDPAVIVRVTRR